MITQSQREFLINRIVDQLTGFLVQEHNLSLTLALKIIYQSKTYQLLQDDEGDLYTQSPSYVYELLTQEIGNNF